MTPECVVSYVGNKLKYGSGVRIKGFAEGMWEIQNTPGIGSKLKVGRRGDRAGDFLIFFLFVPYPPFFFLFRRFKY